MTKPSILIIATNATNDPPSVSTKQNAPKTGKTATIIVEPGKLLKQVNKTLQAHETTQAPYICIFDLDGTLTPSNTTTLMVEQALSQRPLRQILYKKIIKKIMYIAYLAQKKLKTKTDIQKHIQILALKGLTRREEEPAARTAALQAVKQAKRSDINNVLTLMKTLQTNYTVLILSKTLDPLAPHIRSLLKTPIITSKLKYRDEKIAGLKRDINKARYIQALTRLGYKPLIIATDTPKELYPQFPVKIYIIAKGKGEKTR